MKNSLALIKRLAPLVALSFTAGCHFPSSRPQGASEAAWAAIAATNAPVRVAIYEDRGAGDESLFKLNRLVAMSPDLAFQPVDAASIRAGALDEADLFILTGLDEKEIASSLGSHGISKIRRFVARGGSFLGISAGATAALADQPLALAAYTNQPCIHCRAPTTIQTYYGTNAFALAGFKPGTLETRFDFGPTMLKAAAKPGTTTKTMATFKGNVHLVDTNPKAPSMGGAACTVAGTFGKGRVWLFADHPEIAPATTFALRRALTYLAHGRSPELRHPQRRVGQLAIGFLALPAPGVSNAAFAQRLNRSDLFDVAALGDAALLAGDLTHVDALVIPATTTAKDEANIYYAADFPQFVAHGGTVIDLRTLSESEAFQRLAALQGAPAPKPRKALRPTPAELAPHPVRTVFFGADGAQGNGIMRVARMFAASTNYVVRFVEGKDLRAGVLKDADLYIAPGGGAETQAANMGPQGCSNLVAWIRSGGLYHGTCAGAYLVSQKYPGVKKSRRLELLPTLPQKCPYRGGNSRVNIRYTPAGEKALGRKGREAMFYHGGPILLPGRAIPDGDFEVLARFDSQNVYVYNTNTVPAMSEGAAIIAGRLGKGKVMGMSPHPEADDGTEGLVRAEIEYLTGRPLDGGRNWRTRGNLSVAFFCNRYYNDGGELSLDLLDMPGFDVCAQGTRGISSGALEHLDVVVVSHPREATFALFKEFLARGGRLYTWSTSEKEKAYITAARHPNLLAFDSAADCRNALARLSDQTLRDLEARK